MTTSPAQTALQTLRAELKGAFVGRDAEIDGVLLALIARTHCLLLGPPGTAKSLITQTIAAALSPAVDPGASRDDFYFQQLLTSFTTPDEVFGPFDIAGLDAGRYERATSGYAPAASVMFMDEIFKANSGTLNALLTLLNEREFDNGTKRVRCPLQICVGASNEYPADSSLGALYDRFTMRFWTDYVASRAERRRLLTCADPASQVAAKLTADQIGELQRDARAVSVPEPVLDALLDIADRLANEHGIIVSDRRLRQCVGLVRARAALNGRTTAARSDLRVLADSVWRKHDERPAVLATVLECAAPTLAAAQKLADAAREMIENLREGASVDDMEKAMDAILAIESEIGRLDADPTERADVSAMRAEAAACRKTVARRFQRRTPAMLSALGL